MNPRLKFVLLATIIGAATFFAGSLAVAAIELAIHGSGPHGYGTFIYIVAPMYYTPAGAIAGIVAGLVVKSRSYRRMLAGLAATLAAYTLFWVLWWVL